jgi:molybdopterin converting factor small subunit
MTPDAVRVTVRFITIMQKYSGKGRREVEMELPALPDQAVALIIERFQIPWKSNLERQARIFIEGLTYDAFLASGERLKDGDQISFIPISGGG